MSKVRLTSASDIDGATPRSEPDRDEPPVLTLEDDETVYWQLIRENSDICPRCFRWRVPRDRAVWGEVEQRGLSADIPREVIDEAEVVWPPRVDPPTHRRASGSETSWQRATPPAVIVCECGDCDGAEPHIATLSADRAVTLAERLVCRLQEFGLPVDAYVLVAEVRAGKRDPDRTGNDDAVFDDAVDEAVESDAVRWQSTD